MPTLDLSNFNIVCSVLGGFIALFGLVSFLVKERFYLSETLISTVAGAIFSPKAANLIRPLEYALGDESTLSLITLYFSRLVLGIQLVICGVQLPSKYLRSEWRSLAILLGPVMVAMWLCSSLLCWALIPKMKFIYALAVGACVTPTDPVLAANIVKGKFADKYIPKALQNIIIAESGANDGLGYPFLFFALYLIKYVEEGGKGSKGTAGTAMGMWIYDVWVYQIVLGIIYGAVTGYLAKYLLRWSEARKYVDRESFLVFAVALALFIVGTAGLIGSDDVLACFIAGNAFTWDDWFRIETEDDSLQPTVDLLLNVVFFIWIGAVAPWEKFANNDFIPIYRLIPLGLLVLLLRRPPIILALHKYICEIEEIRQAAFMGFFGPIGVSAVFYLYLTVEWLESNVRYEEHEREDAKRLSETIQVVVWFLVICSIFVHGLTIPVGKLGMQLPRTLSMTRSLSQRRSGANSSVSSFHGPVEPSAIRRVGTTNPAPLFVPRHSDSDMNAQAGSSDEAVQAPRAVWSLGRGLWGGSTDLARPKDSKSQSAKALDEEAMPGTESPGTPVSDALIVNRSIRFHDEDTSSVTANRVEKAVDTAESSSGRSKA